MRRGLASLIMGLSLVVATASWAGFILSRTALDPGRSEALADTLLDNEAVRGVIVDRLADAVEAQIPPTVPVTRETIELGAELALEDPRIEAVVRDGIVRTHQNALAGVDDPIELDASALGLVGRETVVGLRPELDEVLPPAPEISVELPGSGLSWLGGVKNAVDRFTRISAVLALIGITTALVVASNRAAVLRRVAFWAFGASLFWVAVAYGVPALLERIAPSSVSIAAAIIDIFLGAMIRPAMIMAGIGVGLLLLSFAWPAIARRRPAALVDRPAPVRPAPASLQHQTPVRPRRMTGAAASGPGSAPGMPGPGHPPTEVVPVVGAAASAAAAGNRYDPDEIGPSFVSDARTWPEPEIPTTAFPEPANGNAAWPAPADHDLAIPHRREPDTTVLAQPAEQASVTGPHWVEGVGYVDGDDADATEPAANPPIDRT